MKRILLAVAFIMAALGSISGLAATQPIIMGDMVSAQQGASITVNTADRNRSRAVWVGVTQSLDFSFDGTNWITFKGCTAGTLLPIQVVGARLTAGSANPNAGDVIFLN